MKYTTVLIVLLCVTNAYAFDNKPIFYFGGDNYYNITGNQSIIQNHSNANLTKLFLSGDDTEDVLLYISDNETTVGRKVHLDMTFSGVDPALSSVGMFDLELNDVRSTYGAIDYSTVFRAVIENPSSVNRSTNNNYQIPFYLYIDDEANYYDDVNIIRYMLWMDADIEISAGSGTYTDNIYGAYFNPSAGAHTIVEDSVVNVQPFYAGGTIYSNFFGVFGYDNAHYKGLNCNPDLLGDNWNSTYCVYSNDPMMHIETAGNITGDYFCGLGGDCIDIDNGFDSEMYGYNGSEWVAVNATGDGRLSVVFG